MNYALVGNDSICYSIAKSVSKSDLDALVGILPVDNNSPSAHEFPMTTIHQNWESLLSSEKVDVLILSEIAVRQWKQWSRFMNRPIHIMANLPAAFSVASHDELEAFFAIKTPALLFPLTPNRVHPAVLQMKQWLSSNNQGNLRSITFHHQFQVPDQASPPARQTSFWKTLASDLDLFRLFAGNVVELCAMRSESDTSSEGDTPDQLIASRLSSSFSLQFRGSHTSGFWHCHYHKKHSQTRIETQTDQARFEIEWENIESPVTIQITPPESVKHCPLFHPGQALYEIFSDTLRKQTSLPWSWQDATRTAESIEAVRRSLRRRRVIQIQFPEPPQEESFKRTMIAVGCGLLCLTVILLFFVSIAWMIGVPGVQYLLYLIPFAMLVFLLLQLLPFSIKGQKPSPSEQVDSPPRDI